MPELDVADLEGMGHSDAVLVSAPQPDGGMVAAALRERGFAVHEVPMQLLAARALADAPRVVIVDVDVPGGVDAAQRAREASPAEMLCIGEPARAAEVGVSRADGRVFERPLDVDSLVLAVLTLAEPKAQGTMPPPSFSRMRETAPPRAAESEAPASEYPSTSDPLDVAVILPALDDVEGGPAPLAAPEISPELRGILASAEERVSVFGSAHPSSEPAPDDVDLLLPPELLAALDEPLEPEDDVGAGGASTGGTGNAPKPKTARETTGAATGAQPDRGTGAEPAAIVATSATSATGVAPPSATPHSFADPVPSVPALPTTPGEPPERVGPESFDLAARAQAAPELEVQPNVAASRARVPDSLPLATSPSITFGEAARGVGSQASAALAASAPPSGRPDATRAPLPARRGRTEPPRAEPPRAPAAPKLPAVLGEGDGVRALAAVIAARSSGSLALGPEATVRRVVLHDGDIVTAASGSTDETLVAFLAARGDLERDVAARLANRIPAQGRHAGAALVAHGHLGQEDLWPVLRAHAEWIIGRALVCDEGTAVLEDEPPGRLKAEPSVFGGATGAEVFLEQVRRVVPPDLARKRLGGPGARLADGPRRQLLPECALRSEDEQLVRAAAGRTVGELLAESEPELADVLLALEALGVLEALAPAAPEPVAPSAFDALDEEALRQRVRARVALVEDGDYFALLGIPRSATGYEVKRAYLELRRAFEPTRVLTAATADLAADVRLVVEVLDEAYEILREPHRRDRYRRAIEAGPP